MTNTDLHTVYKVKYGKIESATPRKIISNAVFFDDRYPVNDHRTNIPLTEYNQMARSETEAIQQEIDRIEDEIERLDIRRYKLTESLKGAKGWLEDLEAEAENE